MRVALVTYALHVGGMESFLLMLAEGLRAAGVDVTFVITEKIGKWHGRPKELGFDTITVRPSPWHSRRWQARRLTSVLESYDAVVLNYCTVAHTILGELLPSMLVISILHNHAEVIYDTGLSNLANIDYVVCVGSKVYSEALGRGVTERQAVIIPYGVDVPAKWPKEQQDPQWTAVEVDLRRANRSLSERRVRYPADHCARRRAAQTWSWTSWATASRT